MPCDCDPSQCLWYETRTVDYAYCSKCSRFRLFASRYKFRTLPEFQRYLHYMGYRERIARPAHMKVVPFHETVARVAITPYQRELFQERYVVSSSPPRQNICAKRVVLFDDKYSVTLGGECDVASGVWYQLRSTVWVHVEATSLCFVGWPCLALYTDVVNTKSCLGY